MGKRAKKETQKQKRVQRPSNDETSDVEIAPVKNRGVCSHIEKRLNLDKLSAKLVLSESIACEDCRENNDDKRANRGKAKQGRRGAKNPKSKAIWICLECGHFSCGSDGLPTLPQSHAVRHSKQNHHSLAVHYENHQQLWCFPCNKLIASENPEAVNEVVKLFEGAGSSTVDVGDVWVGDGSFRAEKSEIFVSFDTNQKSSYLVKGLDNLGNTCFFNSIMQNLLAINSLRGYFFKSDESPGPLSASLRKLFTGTSVEISSKGVINPRSLFSNLCTRAPQFRGYQQHDSHELLRCLLDGLSTEELSARKNKKSDEKSLITGPTFVDTIFGGQLCSTVTCLECGNSSAIHEPFLDLSLPVPNKKPPPKKAPPVVRAKKPKLPPKRFGKTHPKITKSSLSLESGEVQSKVQHTEQPVLPSGDSAFSDSIDSNSVSPETGLAAQDLSVTNGLENQESVPDSFTWLDHLDPTPTLTDIDITLETDKISVNQGSVYENVLDNDVSLPVASELSSDKAINPISSFEEGILAQKQPGNKKNEISQFKEDQNAISQFDGENSAEGSLTKEEVQRDADLDHSSASCNQVSSNFEASSSVIEVSSEFIGDEQDSSVFYGIGDLFNEPEAIEISDAVKTSVVIGNSSDSDPNEVDDTNAPVSVESCLVFFTKKELLSKDEHAWQCDNCSKILREKMTKSKKKLQKHVSDGLPKCCEGNGNVEEEITDASYGNTLPNNVGIHDNGNLMPKNEPGTEMNETEQKMIYDKCGTGVSKEDEKSENLKVERDATKSILISKTPPILTIHLKRFSQDTRGRLGKLNGHVNFKEKIDLKPYMDPRCTGEDKYTYRLVGVVEHSGTMRGGHYVAYVRGTKSNGHWAWYYASDAHVREISLEEVLRSEAYILFYERN